jgi:hypothetical protein
MTCKNVVRKKSAQIKGTKAYITNYGTQRPILNDVTLVVSLKNKIVNGSYVYRFSQLCPITTVAYFPIISFTLHGSNSCITPRFCPYSRSSSRNVISSSSSLILDLVFIIYVSTSYSPFKNYKGLTNFLSSILAFLLNINFLISHIYN